MVWSFEKLLIFWKVHRCDPDVPFWALLILLRNQSLFHELDTSVRVLILEVLEPVSLFQYPWLCSGF